MIPTAPPMLNSWMNPADLAPGDLKSLQRDWSDIELHTITTCADPHFASAYGVLWEQFGASGEIEQEEVLGERFRWDSQARPDGGILRYRMMLITAGEEIAAVRDHTAIVPAEAKAAYVHLSHNLVMPEWRRSGLAGWMRALPMQTAREALAAQGCPVSLPVTLVGEMEHLDASDPARMTRLRAYEKAGYLKVDPSRVPYVQPDFRHPKEIDAAGGPQLLPLTLVIRRVGREEERTISGAEVREVALALYQMYGATFRKKDMLPVLASLEKYPAPEAEIALVAPTQEG